MVPKFEGKDLYLYLTSENPDWSEDETSVELVVHHSGNKVVLPMSDREDVSCLASAIHHFVSSGAIVLAWCAKDIFSFMKGRTDISLELHANMWDIQIVCSYFGYPKTRPASFKEAVAVLKRAFSEPGWSSFKKFYDAVYRPLFSRVMPSIETSCLIDRRIRSCVHPSYVIEGQANGRLKAVRSGASSYNPHSLGPDERTRLRPPGYDGMFVYFDYKNMEVNVLRWLSGDEVLGEMIDSGFDPYKEIWRRVAGGDPTDAQRLMCKNMFLPVVFGQGSRSLASRMGISEKTAATIIDKLVRTFPVAFDWVNSQSCLGDNSALDVFGRRRFFEPGELYKVRNFCIQSPSSMICLRKLVKLYEALSDRAKICFHVHDGYCVVCGRGDVDGVCETGVSILESEDELFPGLSLGVSCKVGPDLNSMQIHKKVQLT